MTIEAVRQYWNRRPCNSRHSNIRVDKDPLLFSQQVTQRKYKVEPHIPGFAQFDRWAGKSVLDAGCGIGTDTISFAQAGAKVVAVDVSEESLEIARRRVIAHDLAGRVLFVWTDLENLSNRLPIRPFDLIYSFGVLHHTPNPARAVAQLRKYMDRDSVFKVMVYHCYSWKALWILLTFGRGRFWRWSELIAEHSEAQTGCPITYLYSRRQARRLLRGFRVTEMGIEHIFPYRIEDYVQHRYVKAWPWRSMPDRSFRWLERRIGWHLLIEARLEETA